MLFRSLVFYRKITEQAGSYLKEGGKLCFEIGYDQGDEVRELMETHDFADVQVLKDLAGLDLSLIHISEH